MIKELVWLMVIWFLAVCGGLWAVKVDNSDKRNIFRMADESRARKCPGMRRHWNGQGRLIP